MTEEMTPGGQLTTTTDVENFPGFPDGIGGLELVMQMREQSVKCGANILGQTVDRVDLSQTPFKVWSEGQEFRTRSLIIATGATASRLRVPSEDRLWNNGISACAVCDGALPMFRNKPLVVVGGGDSACEEATFLSKYASFVYMLVRRVG